MESTLGVKHDLMLMLALGSRIFEYLRETFYGHALEHLQSAGSEKNEKKRFFLRKRLAVIDLYEGLWSLGHVFATSASPILIGPEQKSWLRHPLPLFMAVSMMQTM